ncbi:MAG TPA: NAD-dependent epimerase/dehydratase family protein [Candidatus Hypogeohydataceae bacterium YC41]
MNVLVTGSTGFIGSALVQRLQDRYKIIAIDKALPHPEGASLAYLVDISDKQALVGVMENIKTSLGNRLDFVFHLAAHYDFSNRPDNLYEEVNEKGTMNLLEALKDMEVGAFIFTSSTAVMEAHTHRGNNLLNESSSTGSLLYYGLSKLKAEEILQANKHRLNIIIVRLSGVYSPYCQLIPLAHQIASIYRRDLSSRFLPEGGRGCISYVHLEDALDGFERIMQGVGRSPSSTVYIFSEEDYLPYGELYKFIFKEIHGAATRPVSLPCWALAGGVYIMNYFNYFLGRDYFFKPWMVYFSELRFTFSTEKARRELGWQPRHSVRRGLREMIGRLKADPTDWLRKNKL